MGVSSGYSLVKSKESVVYLQVTYFVPIQLLMFVSCFDFRMLWNKFRMDDEDGDSDERKVERNTT